MGALGQVIEHARPNVQESARYGRGTGNMEHGT